MYAPLNFAGAVPFNDWFTPDSTQRMQLMLEVDAVDPHWGYGTFVYGKAAATTPKGSLCYQTATLGSLALTPDTANLGQSVLVAMNSMAAADYGWYIKSGLAVVKTNATVAALAAIGIGAAGIAGTNSAGKQLLGVTNLKAATATTAITNVQTTNGSCVLSTKGYDGWFLGMALSGTGIPASTVVAKLDPDGKTVYMGSAIATVGDKVATATGAVTVTGTYTGYGLLYIDSPHTQGAIS